MNQLPFEKTERKILVKKESKTDSNSGSDPNERPIEEHIKYGIVNIDKPRGPTSHQVSAYVKNILKLDKCGHSGTLDPNVTGVLPVALAKATKVVQALLNAGKEYVCIMHLHDDIPENKIENGANKFIGKIKQLPPVRSAIKRQMRTRKIYYLDIKEIVDKDILFTVGCQAGTYIRKLCLHPNTDICTSKGLMKASNLHQTHPRIYSMKDGRIIKKKYSATQKIPSPSKLIKITMSSGVSFVVTPDHEMLVSTKKGHEMKEAESLNTGLYLVKSMSFPQDSKEIIIADLLDDEYLIQQNSIKNECMNAFISKYGSIREMNRKLKLDRKAFLSDSKNAITIRHLKLAGIYEQVKKKIHTFKTQRGTVIHMKQLGEDFFYLLGLIASDGNNTKEKGSVRFTRIKFHNKCEELIEHFLKKYCKLFPDVPISKKPFNGLTELDTSNSFFATIAASLGIKSPQKSSDLSAVVNISPKLIRSFLKGYFDGDGSAYYKKKSGQATQHMYIRYHTVNQKDAVNLHKMLLKTGIPNKIFSRHSIIRNKRHKIYDVSVEEVAGMQKFIKEIGSNHSFKIEKFGKILKIRADSGVGDHHHIAFSHKEHMRQKKSKLYSLGGNLNRILKSNAPVTRRLYKKASRVTRLPKLDDFIIERIKSIEKIKGSDYVYDMTVPGTHNFLIETGFVSSNCHDLGLALKSAAHMTELRRTKAGPFNESTLCTLQDLQDAFYYYKEENSEKFLRKLIQPMENAIQHLGKVYVVDSTVDTLCHGANLNLPGVAKIETDIMTEDLVAVLTLKGELIALGKARMPSKKMQSERKGMAVIIEKVFMEPGIYPRFKKE